MNERDSEIMAQALSEYGYVETLQMQDASLIILNTCSIRAKAEQKVMSLLGYLRKTKAKRPQLKICVAGCVAQQEGRKIIEKMNHVDLIVGTQNIYDIGRLLEHPQDQKDLEDRVVTGLKDDYEIPRYLPDNLALGDKVSTDIGEQRIFRKFVTIMQGCNNYCSYCVVPYTRGREVSRKVEDIVDEVSLLVKNGVKEITLLGQNVNSYGQTNRVITSGKNNSYRFADLLREVASTPGLERLRFTTSNPKDLTDDLIDCFGSITNLCPQFHLPVQAGSDRVLKLMNRKYTVDKYLDLIYKLREVCPAIALTTDVIVGFPGESDEDFQGTMNLLEEVKFHGSFSFKYSDRPGTRASEFDNKVEENVKAARLAQFQARQDEISLERNREYIGQEKEVMMESCMLDSAKGRTDSNHIVHFEENLDCNPGDIVQAEIIFAGQHSLKAKKVSG